MSDNRGSHASNDAEFTSSQASGNAGQPSAKAAESLGTAAVETVKKVATESISTMTSQLKDILNRQVNSGADLVGNMGRSTQCAATELEKNSPQFAGFVQGLAQKLEGYSDGLRDKSVDDLTRSAADFTRREPAVVFGLAALFGFLAYRTFKVTQTLPAEGPGNEIR